MDVLQSTLSGQLANVLAGDLTDIRLRQLFWPMFAMFIWTFVVTLRNLQVRIAAVRSRQVRMSYFEIFAGDAPAVVVKTGNHLRNLTEFPPLFYLALLLTMFVGAADGVFVWLSWAYVGLRIAHSVVHLSLNKVAPRFYLFLASQLVLLLIWVRLASVFVRA